MARPKYRKPTRAAQIAERELKGWTAEAEEPERARAAMADETAAVQPDVVMPPIEELKRRFLGDAAMADTGAAAMQPKAKGKTEVVAMRSGPHRKVVGVNTKTGKVEWQQG